MISRRAGRRYQYIVPQDAAAIADDELLGLVSAALEP